MIVLVFQVSFLISAAMGTERYHDFCLFSFPWFYPLW